MYGGMYFTELSLRVFHMYVLHRQATNRRLGMPMNQLPKTVVPDGVPFPIRLNIPGVRVVNLIAGGMSFHALDSQGRVYVWGTFKCVTQRRITYIQCRYAGWNQCSSA